jgi:hypothetical protein
MVESILKGIIGGINSDQCKGFLSLADYFYQHPFAPASIEFAVKNLLPGTEIELAAGDRRHHLPSHDLPLHVGIGIVFANVMAILRYRFMRRQFFKLDVIIMVQPGFIVVDEDGRRYMHRVAEHQALADAALQAQIHKRQ